MIFKLIIFVVYFAFVKPLEWSYEDMTSWSRDFDSCGGNRQSPIDINTNRLRRNPSLRLDLDGLDRTQRNVILRNNGHTAELTLSSEDPTMTINVGRDAVPYVFRNMHFHWGVNNFKGSEHSIDNGFGSGEMHFVHYNKKYGSFSAALNKSDGIAVVAVLMQLRRITDRALEPIISSIPEVINFNSSAVIERFNFARLLPRDTDLFLTYSGSLTTPPCTETVTWIILTEAIPISPIHLSQFRRFLEKSNGKSDQKIYSNRRDIQPLKDRVVEVSDPRC